MTGRLLTTLEVSERLNMSKASVLRRWRSGELPGFRLASNVLRFDGQEIDDWLCAKRNLVVSSDSASRIVMGSTPGLASSRKEIGQTQTEGE